MRSTAKRYGVAAIAFLAAAVWLGVGLKNGFACLFVFVLALQAVGFYQRRSGSGRRRAKGTQDRPPRHQPALAKERLVSRRPAASADDRSQPSRRIYDGGRDDSGWPVPREATW